MIQNYKMNPTTVLCVFALILVLTGNTFGLNDYGGCSRTTTTATRQRAVDSQAFRRELVRQMARDAWNAYSLYAWGRKGVNPVSKRYFENPYYVLDPMYDDGQTLVESLSTLWLMGLKDEFEAGRRWIRDHFHPTSIDKKWCPMFAIPRYLGSLLSCYALTGDTLFMEKAIEIAKVMEAAFSRSKTGIPYHCIIPASGSVSGDEVTLGGAGSYSLELRYVTDLMASLVSVPISSNFNKGEYIPDLYSQNKRALTALKQASHRSRGLYMDSISVSTGKWTSQRATLLKNDLEFFSSLVKSHIQSNGTDAQPLEMYRDAIEAAQRDRLIMQSTSSRLVFIRDQLESISPGQLSYESYMTYESCSLGAMFALGADALEKQITRRHGTRWFGAAKGKELKEVYIHRNLAKSIVDTCHRAANRTNSGLAPKRIYFDPDGQLTRMESNHAVGYISHHLAESYFIMWRLTREQKYRDYAWELAQSIYRYCSTKSGGYVELYDVDRLDSKLDYQPSHFIGSTLKYLYLTFSEPDVLPLDQWVFNSFGYPLPVCGRNSAYPKVHCR